MLSISIDIYPILSWGPAAIFAHVSNVQCMGPVLPSDVINCKEGSVQGGLPVSA